MCVCVCVCKGGWVLVRVGAWVCACVTVCVGALAPGLVHMGVRVWPCLSFLQSACAVFCHLWSLWLHHIFRHYLINGTIFGKKFIVQKMYFDFLYNFYLKHFSF